MESMTKDFIGKHVVITTKSRRWLIMHGTLEAVSGDTVRLKDARCCVYFSAATKTHTGLASHGPAEGSRIARRVDTAIVSGVETVSPATDEATKRWEREEW